MPQKLKEVDVVCIGMGFAGSILAKEMAAAAVPPAIERIASLITEHGASCQRRVVQERPNLWWQSVLLSASSAAKS